MTTLQEQPGTSEAVGSTPSDPVLNVDGVSVRLHGARRATRRAGGHRILEEVSLKAYEGQIVGVIGETGSGKTTLARAILGLVSPVAGTISLDGQAISKFKGKDLRDLRRSGKMQLVFQDPLRSLDPDFTVGRIVEEGLVVQNSLSREERADAVSEALRIVGLDPAITDRRPGQISGGQRQRVAIARAVILKPRLLVCDEPVSALDASTRNYILKILGELREQLSLSMVVISHDLGSLAGIADRVAVLYRGRIVEEGPIEGIFAAPRHPYTALLIASAPSVSRARWSFNIAPKRLRLEAGVERELSEDGCVFAHRCPFATLSCLRKIPPTTKADDGWTVACHHSEAWRSLVADGAQ